MPLATIVIPVYKEDMDSFERISFVQVCKILKKYPITLVCPQKLNINNYLDVCPALKVETFTQNYFDGLEGYNKLMLSPEFYHRFRNNKYILIYQLDSFVFRDELQYWCDLGYDYIGAPWFTGWHESTSESGVKGVGNGGFSLRNVKSILNQIKILNRVQMINKYCSYNWNGLFVRFPKVIFDLFRYNSLTPTYKLTHGQEDYFWCFDMKDIYDKYVKNKCFVAKLFKIFPIKSLEIPDVEAAFKFSMECQPARLYKMNNNKLPFGCHAWSKYDIEFWKPFIISEGYGLS